MQRSGRIYPKCAKCGHSQRRHGYAGCSWKSASGNLRCDCRTYLGIKAARPKARKPIKPKRGPSKRDTNRKLAGVGLSRRDDEATKAKALAEIAAYEAWIREQGPLIFDTHGRIMYGWDCATVEASHTDSRGSHGADFGNLLPLTRWHHRIGPLSLHVLGQRSFEQEWRKELNGKTLAWWGKEYHRRYVEQSEPGRNP